jgi:hypothetical protein
VLFHPLHYCFAKVISTAAIAKFGAKVGADNDWDDIVYNYGFVWVEHWFIVPRVALLFRLQ